mgnify:CR=1 FL=1|tara:strand:+ start:3617 stop:5113 length:1497 start_codon:yes stop_codon:yes gene_type:complete
MNGTDESNIVMPSLFNSYFKFIFNIFYSLTLHVWKNKKMYLLVLVGITISYILINAGLEVSEEEDAVNEEKTILHEDEINDGDPSEQTKINSQLKGLYNPGGMFSAMATHNFNTMIEPHIKALDGLQNITGNLTQQMQQSRKMFYYIRNSAKKSYLDAQNKILNIYSRLIWLFKKIIKIFSDMFRFMEHIFLALLDTLFILGSTWNGVIGGTVRFFCFDEFTKLDNGSFIKDIKIGDKIGDNCFVKSVMKFESKYNEMFEYKNIIVSGSHEVLEQGKWVRVSQSKIANILSYHKPFIYCLETSTGEIPIRGIRFKDFYESTDKQLLNKYYTLFRDYLNTRHINIKKIQTYKGDYYNTGFTSDTTIKCWGKDVKINKINIGDTIYGSKVIGIVKTSSKNVDLYKYDGIKCSGNNVIYNKGLYRLIKHIGKPIVHKPCYLYHIMTDDNRLVLGNNNFRDFNVILDDTIIDITDHYMTTSSNLEEMLDRNTLSKNNSVMVK